MDFKNSGGSVLVVTHDINFAKEISDEIAFLHDNTLSEFVDFISFFNDYRSKTI